MLLVKFFRKMRVISRSSCWARRCGSLGYKLGLLKVTQASREKGAGILQGLTEDEVDALMERFTDEVLVPRLHPACTAALAEHLAEGDLVVVVSAALDPVVDALCRRLGVRALCGGLVRDQSTALHGPPERASSPTVKRRLGWPPAS